MGKMLWCCKVREATWVRGEVFECLGAERERQTGGSRREEKESTLNSEHITLGINRCVSSYEYVSLTVSSSASLSPHHNFDIYLN